MLLLLLSPSLLLSLLLEYTRLRLLAFLVFFFTSCFRCLRFFEALDFDFDRFRFFARFRFLGSGDDDDDEDEAYEDDGEGEEEEPEADADRDSAPPALRFLRLLLRSRLRPRVALVPGLSALLPASAFCSCPRLRSECSSTPCDVLSFRTPLSPPWSCSACPSRDFPPELFNDSRVSGVGDGGGDGDHTGLQLRSSRMRRR